ncbi:MaoC family dehydratase N-terminal domain-containing protein [Noviherbaspirillum sp. Root189]|uniref:MaoC family dehydratase N-terminal domain-containing protein n=1 Tax=Noviherbaspirillum sp. Root189 TaxID=1736487 RepID=UPI000710F4E9|nr:MaoC family dehydratase N-terminal domain-containing protein [Noviherbaspirillum sp. Root189]KRB84059.1 acyl dehydratase [Noviherbaspirillum sp. Root189]
MIDRKHIGRIVSRHQAEVERGRLRLFAKAIGETDRRWTEGERLPVPPTFLFCLDMERHDPYDWYAEVGLELPKVLHGEQSFTYMTPCHSGDVLSFETRIEDIYDKKGGALEFLVKSTRVSSLLGEHVADLRTVIVQRHG